MAISDGVSSSDSKEVVRLFYRAIIAGDLKQVVAMLHPDIEIDICVNPPGEACVRTPHSLPLLWVRPPSSCPRTNATLLPAFEAS